jgi:hypothetical protein
MLDNNNVSVLPEGHVTMPIIFVVMIMKGKKNTLL